MLDQQKPTHVQHFSRLSFDKMMRYFAELEMKGTIYRDDNWPIFITSKLITHRKL